METVGLEPIPGKIKEPSIYGHSRRVWVSSILYMYNDCIILNHSHIY